MANGFFWRLGDYVGGDVYVHQAYKPYLVLGTPDHEQQAVGEFLIQPRDTADLVVSGLGFAPTAIILVSYRPKYANGTTDSAFGARGGGMTFGVAGWEVSTTTEWDAAATYGIGDRVTHGGNQYVYVGSLDTEPPSGDWALVPFAQYTGSTRIRHAFEQPQARWREDVAFNVVHKDIGVDVLTLSLASIEADGFTLSQDVNLYDQTDYVAWIALGGKYSIGVIDAGDTSISGFDGTPHGAMFLSVKNKTSDGGTRNGYWDHMTGFAARGATQAAVWGGRQPTSWDWTTERWEDASAILLCQPASGASFAGTSILAQAAVSDWLDGGLDLTWSVFNGQPYRIGYLLAGIADSGVIETSWETRPHGSLVDADGNNHVDTAIRPDVVLMAATNYTWNTGNSNPLDIPRSPGAFQFGGSGGLGFHAAPFSELGYDAYGVHTFGNSVAERGHFANSGTQYLRRSIMAGQGANSNPPAYHQHSINILDFESNPLIVGTNWRVDADRRASGVGRGHIQV